MVLFGQLSLRRLTSACLDLIFSWMTTSDSSDERRARQLLRKFPWWSGGHLHIFDIQLARREFYSAGVSVHALRILRGEDDLCYRYAQGRLLLAVGELEQAAHLLDAVVIQSPQLVNAREDYAAALIALDQGQRAYEILCGIPEHKRSAMVRDMLVANRR